jgi:NAD(P)H-dependent FMN reductase
MSRIKALLLVGSPRGERSNSNAFGTYLLKKMESYGAEVSTEYMVRRANKPGGLETLASAVDAADVIVIAAPLYIDSIPAYVIRALEHIRDARKAVPAYKRQRLFVVVNSGFPEPEHNHIALDMYRLFARETGMEWAGGIPRGWGMAVDRRPLETLGGMTMRLRSGLDEVASALARDEPVPEKAIALAVKPFMPMSLGRLMMIFYGKRMWNSQVQDKNVLAHMYDRPYQR